ncbi:fatty acid desaturase family protein [Flavitalea antarctica]
MVIVTPSSGFVDTLYRRADVYFKTQRNHRFASPLSHVKSSLLILLYVFAYSCFLFRSDQFLTLLGWAALLGICHVLIPVNIAHDAIHETLSARQWVNRLGLLGFEITGANAFMYRSKHLEAHANKEKGNKINTIEGQGLLLQKGKNGNTVNLPYFLYLFYAIYMIFVRDFQLFYSETAYVPKSELLKLYVAKLLYAIAFLVLPFALIELPPWQILCALLLLYVIISILLVIILLMPTEKMEHSKFSDNNNYNDKWAMEILAHNVDFSPGNRFLNNLAGGSNLNVVHYLFPATHHVHYNRLAKIVEETTKAFGLLYRKQKVSSVLGIHFKYIKDIQQQEQPIPPAGDVNLKQFKNEF